MKSNEKEFNEYVLNYLLELGKKLEYRIRNIFLFIELDFIYYHTFFIISFPFLSDFFKNN